MVHVSVIADHPQAEYMIFKPQKAHTHTHTQIYIYVYILNLYYGSMYHVLKGQIKYVVGVYGMHLSVFNIMDHNGMNSKTRKLHTVITGTNRTRVAGAKHCSVFATKQIRFALSWDSTQHTAVIPRRRFGTNYRSLFQGSRDSTLIDSFDA